MRLITTFMVLIVLSLPSYFAPAPLTLPFPAGLTVCLATELDERQIVPILNSAEALFKGMKARNYRAIWEGLSAKSQKTILHDLVKAMKNDKPRPSAADIEADLRQGGPIAQSYWNAIVAAFNPDMVLEQSKWEMGPVKKDRAEIDILYKKSQRPAVLQMFRENNRWKVGLVETFWGRK